MSKPIMHIHATLKNEACDVFLQEKGDRNFEILASNVSDATQNFFQQQALSFLNHGEDLESSLQKLGAKNIDILTSEDAQKAYRMDTYLRNMVSQYGFNGTVSIKRDGKEFFCRSYGEGNAEGTRYAIGSMSKMMTAAAMMKMIQDTAHLPDDDPRKVKLDDKINKHLPTGYPRVDFFEGITIRHLLSHTSGLVSCGSTYEDDARTRLFNFDDLYNLTLIMSFVQKLQPDEHISQILPAKYKERFADITVNELINHELGRKEFKSDEEKARYQKIGELYELVINGVGKEEFGRGLLFEPGIDNEYSTLGYVFLGEILKHKSGAVSYENYMMEHIFKPHDMTETSFSATPGTSQGEFPQANMPMHISKAGAGGGIYSTVRDLEKWDALLYDDDFLSEETRTLMFTPDPHNPKFGLGFNVRSYFGGMVGHNGAIVGFNSSFKRNIDRKDLAVTLEGRRLQPEDKPNVNADTITKHLLTILYS